MTRGRRGAGRLAAILLLLALVCPPLSGGAQQLIAGDEAAGLAAWDRIQQVLTHPRCLNCHSMTDYPRQGDDRRVHVLQVKRGPDGRGEGPKCQACHTEANKTGIPGAPDWHMPPADLGWEKAPGEPASAAAICATLKQPKVGEEAPDYERLIETTQFAPFVLWAWEPGQRRDGTARTPPPIPHQDFVDAVKHWISAGAPCPAPQE